MTDTTKGDKPMTTKQPKPKTREELEGKAPERDAQGKIIIPEGWEIFRHQMSEGFCYDPAKHNHGWQYCDSWVGSIIHATYIRPKTSAITTAPSPKPTKIQRDIAATEARLATLRDLDQAERDLAANKTKGGELKRRIKELQAKLGAG